MEIGKTVRLGPPTWPGKALEVQPGDLSKLVPDGLGIGGPFVIRPWDDPFGPSPAGYYGLQARTGLPYLDAPIANAAGGTVYFDDSPRREDLDALLRLMGVRAAEPQYAAFFERSENTLEQRYVSHMRLVCPFGLSGLFGASVDGDAAELLRQDVTLGDALFAFIQGEQDEWGTGMGGKLSGAMGGDGDWAKESLCFGFMVENGYQGVYRIWSRAWLVTK
jgi:hypothetical protein